jgi:hypothetical protein
MGSEMPIAAFSILRIVPPFARPDQLGASVEPSALKHDQSQSGNMIWAVWCRYRRQLAHSCPPLLSTQKFRRPYWLMMAITL